MTENKRYVQFEFPYDEFAVKDNKTNEELWNPKVVDRLNEQEEEIQELLKYKYLIKALEEVSGSHYIEEIISDYSDGAVSDEKEQLELGKWHSEHGLSWENGDVK